MYGFTPATRFERTPDLEMRFPPLPRTLAEVSKLLAERADAPNTHRLGEIVNTDPMIAASVLRRINSAYYGIRRRISDIQRAVFLLGFVDVCNIVLTAGMLKLRDVIHTDEQNAIFERIMRMSIGAACYTQEIARFLELPLQNTAFTAGLLHTAGRLVLLYNKPFDYEALWWTREDGAAPTAEEEQLIFGTDHTVLGAMAACHWQLPEEVAATIRGYLAPHQLEEAALVSLAKTLAVAAAAAEQLYLSGGEEEAFEPSALLYDLASAEGVSPDALIAFIESLQDKTYAFIEGMAQA